MGLDLHVSDQRPTLEVQKSNLAFDKGTRTCHRFSFFSSYGLLCIYRKWLSDPFIIPTKAQLTMAHSITIFNIFIVLIQQSE